MKKRYIHHVILRTATGGHETINFASIRRAKRFAKNHGGDVIEKAKNITNK